MWQASGLKRKSCNDWFNCPLSAWCANSHLGGACRGGKIHCRNSAGWLSGYVLRGALTSVSILALGIGPYITASIIMQLLTVVVPKLEGSRRRQAKPGDATSQYTRYMTVALALIQGGLIIKFITSIPGALFPRR